MWYFGLGVVDGPEPINEFLGGAGSENPGYDHYPASKGQIVAAAREELGEGEDANTADLLWLDQHLPEATYRDAGEVFAALLPVIQGAPFSGTNWVRGVKLWALPIGSRLVVPPNQVAMLLQRPGEPLDAFSPGEYILSRETAPLAAAKSRTAAPDFPWSVLRASPTFYSSRDQEGTLRYTAKTQSREPVEISATVRYALQDPRKLVTTPAGKNLASVGPPPEKFLTQLLGPGLDAALATRDPQAVVGDTSGVATVIRGCLEGAGFSVQAVSVDRVAPFSAASRVAAMQEQQLAGLPPEMRAQVQAQMAEVMARRAAAIDRSAAGPPAPTGTSPTAGPSRDTSACPSCGKANPTAGEFCQHCGSPLSPPRKCPACGTEAAPGVKFCGNCGTKLA